jgi:hypothetical protein
LVELIFRPSVPDNITNWRVFDDDDQILKFLTQEGTFKDSVIDENQHNEEINEISLGNSSNTENGIPKSVVNLEFFYDLQDKFKRKTNCKTNSSSMQYEVINLGTDQNPQNINLGINCSPSERNAFIKLFKEYKDIFAWTYDDLKVYDTKIIQHVIPTRNDAKLVQQKLRKIHPNLELQIKKELNKLLQAKIIFPVRHSQWVSNLVPVRKKNGDIRICIDFQNLNKASEKDNYHVPPMEQILQRVVGSEMFSF